jgi:hypothetical protein
LQTQQAQQHRLMQNQEIVKQVSFITLILIWFSQLLGSVGPLQLLVSVGAFSVARFIFF